MTVSVCSSFHIIQIKDKHGFQGDVRGFIAHLMNQTENMYNSSVSNPRV